MQQPSKTIPLFSVFMSHDVDKPLLEVLHSGYIGQGKKVEEFEHAVADYIGNPYVLTLNSATSGLHLAYRLAGVGPGSTVISTPQTCSATNLPILANGGRPVWAEINPDTGLIDPTDVERKITPTTKAIVCVDWGGTPCDLDALMAIGERHGIPVIEDAAHSFGATYKGRKIGTIADFTVFSYQAIKTLTTVDGGALVVKDPERYRRGKLLRWYGIDRESPRTTDSRIEEDIAEYGYKFHMNDVTATIGLHQLPHLEDTLTRHRANAASYQSRIDDRFYTHPRIGDYAYTGSYWLYTLLLPDQDQRLAFMQFMAEHGVMVSQVHSRNDTHTVFKESRTELPGVTAFCERQVSIPVHWALTEEQRQTIVDLCNEFAKQAV